MSKSIIIVTIYLYRIIEHISVNCFDSRLGSDRFSKPRSDRIHSVDFDDDGPGYEGM